MKRPGQSAYAAPMRSFALVLLISLGATACRIPAPTPADWMAVGYRTPEQCLRTFQTALAGEDPSLEFSCLSEGLKASMEVTELTYREGRDRLEDEQPYFRYLARGEVVASAPGERPDRHRLEVLVQVLWIERRFEIDFVRQDYYTAWVASDPEYAAVDDWAELESIVRHVDEPSPTLEVSLPFYAGPTLADVLELRVGREWKIDGFRQLTEP